MAKYTESKSLKIIKQIIITQLLSIVFAIISEIHLRFLITYDGVFAIILILGIILLPILYTVLVSVFLEGNWLNVILISFPYIIYWFISLFIISELFPLNIDPNDYGAGIEGLFTSICQWFGILIASTVGISLKKKDINFFSK